MYLVHMLPIFKSHYSIGKSILTLNPPKSSSKVGSDSIFDLVLDNKLKELFLIEDVPTGFLAARKTSLELDVHLVFGLRMLFSCESKGDESVHKSVILARSDRGCELLNLIYSDINCNMNGVGTYKLLKKYWNNDDLLLCVPFYDSFLFENSFKFSSCAPDFNFCSPMFFIENNGLPFDSYLANLVLDFCKKFNYEHLSAKSIFYNKRSDLEAFQAYKCICNRNFGRNRSLSNPMLDHFGSNEFCFESWLEYKK
jgi:hypothetical protein